MIPNPNALDVRLSWWDDAVLLRKGAASSRGAPRPFDLQVVLVPGPFSHCVASRLTGLHPCRSGERTPSSGPGRRAQGWADRSLPDTGNAVLFARTGDRAQLSATTVRSTGPDWQNEASYDQWFRPTNRPALNVPLTDHDKNRLIRRTRNRRGPADTDLQSANQ